MSQDREIKNLELRTEKAINELEDKLAKNKISKAEYNKWMNKLEEYLTALHKQEKTLKSDDILVDERFKLYHNPEVQKLLTHFFEDKLKKLTPFLDKDIGIRYPSAERIMGTSPNETKEIIEELVQNNILLPEVHSKGLKCPRCRSNNVITLYVCPFCQSANFDKSKIIEHFKCHYMDIELKFKKDQDLMCPNCNSVLKQIGVDYQKHGPWFKCNECQKIFDEPLSSNSCGDCGSVFELQQAAFVNLYSYFLNKKFQDEYINVTIPISTLIEKIKPKNWTIRSPAFIIGISGIIHQFFSALWNKKDEEVILPVDPNIIMEVIIKPGGISSDSILNFSAKAQDIAAPIKLLIGIPRFELKAEEIAENYGITLLSINNRDEFTDRVSDFIFSSTVQEKLETLDQETLALESALKTLDKKILPDAD